MDNLNLNQAQGDRMQEDEIEKENRRKQELEEYNQRTGQDKQKKGEKQAGKSGGEEKSKGKIQSTLKKLKTLWLILRALFLGDLLAVAQLAKEHPGMTILLVCILVILIVAICILVITLIAYMLCDSIIVKAASWLGDISGVFGDDICGYF
ncbi:MAG: hypothetical protein ABIJ91_01400 [Candidatus Kuenenbacteria bacterium]